MAKYILFDTETTGNRDEDRIIANLSKDGESETYNSEFERTLKELIYDTKSSIENSEFGFDNSNEKKCD